MLYQNTIYQYNIPIPALSMSESRTRGIAAPDKIQVQAENVVDLPTEETLANACCGEDAGWTCAICLEEPAHTDRCAIVGCEHVYCGTRAQSSFKHVVLCHADLMCSPELDFDYFSSCAVSCIVHWASTRSEAARCPTCKNSFTLISLNKNLDGSLSQSPVEETVAMVSRSSWFKEWLAARERFKSGAVGTAQNAGPRSAYSLMQEEWAEDELYSYFEQEFDEDDAEDYYVGRSTGRRHAFGNRPFGSNGYMRAGRRLAAVPRHPNNKTPGAMCSSSASCSSGQSTQKSAVKGRRAQRKAKRASADE